MRALTLLLALFAASCAAPVDLAYAPPASLAQFTRPVIAAVRVADRRVAARAPGPRDAGAVIGTDGKPFWRLETGGSVADAVARSFHDALAARGELAPDGLGTYDLDVTILALDGEQWAERQGEADLLVRLIDRKTGRAVYSARTDVQSRGDNYLAMDNFELGSPAALGRVTDAVLNRAINDTLGRGGFVLALR